MSKFSRLDNYVYTEHIALGYVQSLCFKGAAKVVSSRDMRLLLKFSFLRT